MRSTLAIAGLAVFLLQVAIARAEQPSAPADEAGQRAIAIAADHLDIRADRLAVLSVEARTWTDSSLGCPKPGRRYLPGTFDGFVVTVAHGSERYRVHLGDDRGLVCEGVLREGP
ncbi:hypothetical protein [Microbulbifer sp. YPW16]|uniref:hypothetical protein n=1 Tax=Microbulbifer sp. YPW16 TaxID=2904242 RepID=UPI001E39EAF5|nr:hypothetical protein [Microbulbifer sp. YPW16]UHQ54007.1 hypothetical protein LVE68_10820 [Microbulbifer sp. YPW16]